MATCGIDPTCSGGFGQALPAVLKNYHTRIQYRKCPGETVGKIHKKGFVGTIREVGKKRNLG